MISTVSESLCRENNLQIQPLDGLLKVQGVGGQRLGYLGYVEARINFPSLDGSDLDALFLVVSDTDYHSKVPVLIGTNLLKLTLFKDCNSQGLATAWQLVRKSLESQAKIDAMSGSIATVRVTKNITVPPSGRTILHGHTRLVSAACGQLCVMVEGSSGLPGGLVVSPGILHLAPGVLSHRLGIEVNNLSSRLITISAKTAICEVHQVALVPPDLDDNPTPSSVPAGKAPFLDQFHDGLLETLSTDQVAQVESLLLQHQQVFSQHDLDLGSTNMTI
jgi:hypothetical protein